MPLDCAWGTYYKSAEENNFTCSFMPAMAVVFPIFTSAELLVLSRGWIPIVVALAPPNGLPSGRKLWLMNLA